MEAKVVLKRLGLQIPTEAQWEKAARGGTNTIWYSGSDKRDLEGHVNVADASFARERPDQARNAEGWAPFDDGFGTHAPVGSFKPNPYGLYDVLGNVAEWVQDFMSYAATPAMGPNGSRDPPGTANQKGLRGGSYQQPWNMTRCSARMSISAYGSISGLRPCRAVE